MHLRHASALLAILAVAGCAQIRDSFGNQSDPGSGRSGRAASDSASGAQQASAQSSAPVAERFPSAQARSVEDFDLTTDEEKQAAATPKPEPQGERSLGTTVASLGDPASQGFWLETPLVDAETEGRIVYPKTGKSANVTLRPIPGEASAGSRISLAAMRLIEAQLTDLPTVEVYAGG